MDLTDQVTNLEISKKLKELGVKQKSLFYYQNIPYSNGEKCIELMIVEVKSNNGENVIMNTETENDDNPKYSAFTASELMQLLPYHITTTEPEPFNSYRLYISGSVIVKNPECIDPIRTHIVNYRSDTYDMNNPISLLKYIMRNIWDENPANALAKMLIYLIENELINKENENNAN